MILSFKYNTVEMVVLRIPAKWPIYKQLSVISREKDVIFILLKHYFLMIKKIPISVIGKSLKIIWSKERIISMTLHTNRNTPV